MSLFGSARKKNKKKNASKNKNFCDSDEDFIPSSLEGREL
jgi:hypothetical protein